MSQLHFQGRREKMGEKERLSMNVTDHDRDYLKHLRLLYVEDESETREEMGYFLKRMVGELFTAQNGAEGLAVFKRHSPDLIVSDILMPGMDGLSMTAAIRQIAPDIPVIVTTAFERTDYLLQSIEVGIDRYVVKPVNMEKLTEALLACARRLRGEETLRRQRERDAELRRHEAFGLLAGGMAHDYNNLLQGLTGCLELARMVAEPESPTIEYLDRAVKISIRGRELGNNLQLLARGGIASFAVSPIGPTLINAVEHTIRRSQTAMGAPTYTVGFEITPDLPELEHDAAMLSLVFSHLTINALEAMPSGGNLSVAARPLALTAREALPGPSLEITFQDQGTGIVPENLERIFEPYFSTKERGTTKGMGLGLALCRSIVAKHGGRIAVESAPGQGATFRLHLPVRRPDPTA